MRRRMLRPHVENNFVGAEYRRFDLGCRIVARLVHLLVIAHFRFPGSLSPRPYLASGCRNPCAADILPTLRAAKCAANPGGRQIECQTCRKFRAQASSLPARWE